MNRRTNVATEPAALSQSQGLFGGKPQPKTTLQLGTYSGLNSNQVICEQISSESCVVPPQPDIPEALRRPASAASIVPKLSLLETITARASIEQATEHKEPHLSRHATGFSTVSVVSDRYGPASEGSQVIQQGDLPTQTEPPILQGLQPPLLDYSNPKQVPGTNLMIYPHASINRAFDKRYPHIVELFKSAVDEHKILKHYTTEINYDLRLCGSNPADASAAIIIFCAEAIFNDLRKLLNSAHIRRQYQPKKHSIASRLSFLSSPSSIPESSPVIVPFKLVFWRVPSTPAIRRSRLERVIVRGQRPITMCGSLTTYGNRSSTLGLVINIKSKNYGLTVDHLFTNYSIERHSDTKEDDSNTSSQDDESEVNRADSKGKMSDPEGLSECWTDDVKYDSLEDEEMALAAPPFAHETPQEDAAVENSADEESTWRMIGHRLDPTWEENPSRAYRDWALIDFEDAECGRLNAFYTQDAPEKPKLLSKFSSTPVLASRPIYMISGASGTREGVLLQGNSYIGGTLGQDLCRALNVILSDSTGRY